MGTPLRLWALNQLHVTHRDSRQAGTVINLNVSGAINSEETARIIIENINASGARGGAYSGTPFGQAGGL